MLDACGRYRALPSGGALGFMLCKVGEALLRAVQGRLHCHDRGHERALPDFGALLRPGVLGFMLCKVGEAPLRAVQGRLHYHDRGH